MAVLNDRGDNAPNGLDGGRFSNENPNGKDFTTVFGGAIPPVAPGTPAVNPGPATVPGQPVIASIKATGVAGQIQVSFYPPGNGGSAITGYQIRNDEQAVLATVTTSPATVSGLKSKVSTRVAMTATNALGTSKISAESGLVTPA